MNIFILDYNPVKNAQAHADQHVNKMILEVAQMLCANVHLLTGVPQEYSLGKGHSNHPCTKWIRESECNFLYAIDYAHYLNEEAKLRYNKSKNHASYDVISNLELPDNLPQIGLTEFARAINIEKYKNIPDTVEAYREYYKTKTFLQWKKCRNPPVWWNG